MKIAGIYTNKREDPSEVLGIDEPLGLEMILGVAQQQGHIVDLFLDGNLYKIIDFEPELAVFSSTTSQISYIIELNNALKNKISNLISVIGGYHVSAVPETILEGFDYAVIGEGEETFRELLKSIECGKDPSDIKGLVLNKDGKILINNKRERISDLDLLPPPFRSQTVISQKSNYIGYPEASKRRVAYLEWERGCPYGCNFCASPQVIGRNVFYRSPKIIIEQIKDLKERFGINSIFFTDLNMPLNGTKFIELLNALIAANLGVSWSFMASFSSVWNIDLFNKLKKSGCVKIAWGIENIATNSNEIKKQTIKLPEFKKIQEILNMAADHGIINEGFYIIGWPHETIGDISEVGECLKILNLHCLRPTIFTPFPGTGAYQDLEQALIKPILWNKFDTNHLVFIHPQGLTEDGLRAQQKNILSQFYNSKEYKQRIRKFVNDNPRYKLVFAEFLQNFI